MRLLALLLLVAPAAVLAQGTDQPPAQRDLMVIGEWLGKASDAPRHYDSIEQAYFEARRIKPGSSEKDAIKNPRRSFTTTRLAGDALAYGVERDGKTERWTLTVDTDGNAVRVARGNADPRCDVLLRREAGQFAGRTSAGCAKPGGLLVTDGAIWEGEGADIASWTRYRRARLFQCFVDVPGVGGGRAVPYKRFGPFPVYDQGGSVRFTTHETPSRTLEIKLRNVAWGYNNAPGQFTRNSLTMYISEIDASGKATEGAYVFGEPTAQRIGVNLKHLLANCAMVPLENAKPEF
jgi:hypothetical protein